MNFLGAAESLSEYGLSGAANMLGCGEAEILSVIQVETSGCGFLKDKRPAILFERHVFSRLTLGEYDVAHPEISSAAPGGYGAGGAHQYDRLAAAMALDENAALRSASWGIGQLMGFNAELVGYKVNGVRGMIAAFCDHEDAQLLAFARFCKVMGIDDELRSKDWAGFARRYNGPGYRGNRYDERLAAAYAAISGGRRPDLAVRAEQMRLLFAGLYDGAVDGILGPKTLAARMAAA